MKIETNELKGVQLDWAVAQCEGKFIKVTKPVIMVIAEEVSYSYSFQPTTNWAQAGSIIERENISIRKLWSGGKPIALGSIDAWRADLDFQEGVMTLGKLSQYGGTPLEAAMRCYVQSKIGDSVEIPEELL